MSISYYVSSKLIHAELWESVNTCSSWLEGEKLSDPIDLAFMWTKYRAEIEECDALAMYIEDGWTYKGCLFEAGMAFELGKPIFIIYNGLLSDLSAILGTWIHHPQVTIIKYISELPK